MQPAKDKEKRKRWSEAVDKRMPTISVLGMGAATLLFPVAPLVLLASTLRVAMAQESQRGSGLHGSSALEYLSFVVW
jgi:hypothetical protein